MGPTFDAAPLPVLAPFRAAPSSQSDSDRPFAAFGCFIQQLLGHARLDTTQIYTEVSIVQLREVHARTHPHGKA